MKNRKYILEKLYKICSPLANIPYVNPYVVPKNFFTTSKYYMFQEIKTEIFNIPARISLPYSIPEGYFDALPEQILAIVKNSEAALPKSIPYTVPQEYFNFLPEKILAAVLSEDRTFNVSKDIPFTVPTGYFETLPQQMLQKAKGLAEPKEKQKKSRHLKRKYIWHQLRLAAAAVLLLGIGFSSFQYYLTSSKPETALAKLPNDAIKNYIEQNIDDFDADMIESNLDAASLNVAANNIDAENIPSNISSQTKQLSNKDIVQYLNETGWK